MQYQKLASFYAYLSGSIVLAFALFIIVGWHIGRVDFVQLYPGMVPMQHNTALSFVFIATSLLLARGKAFLPACSIASAVLALIFAFVVGTQYVTGQNYGIDSFFVDPFMNAAAGDGNLQAKTAFPGRMAPNTVLCVLLVAASLLLWHFSKQKENRLDIVLIPSSLTTMLSLTALLGYGLGIEAAYGWWSLSDMSLQAAGNFFLLSTGVLALVAATPAEEQYAGSKEWAGTWKSLGVGLLGIVLTLSFAQSLLEHEAHRMKTILEARANKAAKLAEHGMKGDIQALERMQARWERQNGMSQEDWRIDAGQYLYHNRSYHSLAIADRNFKIINSVSNDSAPDFWAGVDFDKTLSHSANRKSPVITRLSRQGRVMPEFLVYLPLQATGDASGFLLAAYRLEDEMQSVLSTEEKYVYEIFDAAGVLSSNAVAETNYAWEVAHETQASIYGVPLYVRVTQDASGYENGGLVFLIFIGGASLSLMIAHGIRRTEKIKHFAARLAISDERYTLAVEGADIALWDWNTETAQVTWAGQAWKLFGVKSNKDVSTDEREVRKLIPPEDNQKINDAIANDLKTGDRFSAEFRLRQPDNRYKWMQVSGKCVERKNGNPLRSVGIYMDITHRRMAEEELSSYRAKLESILENTVDGLITIDERGIVQSYNKACEKTFGYAPEEVIGQNVKMLMPAPYAGEHDQYLKSYMHTGDAKIIGSGREVEGRRKDGSHFPLDLSVAEVKLDSGRIFSGIVRDITHRKQSEGELKRINEELEQFAYIASHDLKAPLRSIDNLAKWIEEDLREIMTGSTQEKLQLMRGRVSRLEMLLEDILQYSRAGRVVDQPVEIDTGDLVRQVAESLVLPNGFKVSVAQDMPVLTTAYTPLQQIFLNLIANAWKHHDQQNGHIKIAAVDHGPYYEFSVSDDGPGIPPEFHERVFKMFQTLQSRDKKEGSGLGMSIIKKLVEWQGGAVWIVSDPSRQRGTDVRFRWPKRFINERKAHVK